MSVSGKNTGVYVFTASADSITGSMYVKHIRWVGATTAGHMLTLKDTAGNVLFGSEADGAHFLDVHPFYRYFNGIQVASMDSGTLYVYTNSWGDNK